MYEPEFHCPTMWERELCPWYLELWRQMPSSPFELDLYLECHPDDGETDQHSICQCTNAFFPSLPTTTEDDLQELSSSASHNMYEKKHVRPLFPTGSVGNVEIVIEDYFQLSNNMSQESSMFH
ncbi:hypothetical protein SELMODRAFT_417875 [Selaginella moellendorffii]|uniref:Uncharacterized protein n=1 Tax=Selaginella moellendorffii TaxID=88036 RepID=D8S3X9_SELML|nr:hypothetical protein SELMODRAFT_417875 [Selaginella moellendorffii]